MSQSDLYQMYAYQKRYNSPLSLLIYPFHETLGSLSATPPAFRTLTDSDLRVLFWNPANAPATSASAASVFAAALERPHELDT
jgi:5-methylcytosine-specific restriction endonuclease McrBC regulatory subunit McrC